MNFQKIIFAVNSNNSNHKVDKGADFMALGAGTSEVADIKEEPEIKHNSNISRENLENMLKFPLHYQAVKI